MSPEELHMTAYVVEAFRARFPSATRVIAALDGHNETWIAVVDDAIYAMPIGSDDDQFSFYRVGEPATRVTFPISEVP